MCKEEVVKKNISDILFKALTQPEPITPEQDKKIRKNIKKELGKLIRYQYCPECGKKLEIEEGLFGFFLTCKDCGLGLGCDEKGEIDEQNKKAWNEWRSIYDGKRKN